MIGKCGPAQAMNSISDKFAAAQAAAQGVLDLYALAHKTAELHRKAGQQLPPPIQALVTAIVGPEAAESEPKRPKLKRRPITSPFPILREGWISVAVGNALPQTLVPVLLAEAGHPLDSGALGDAIRKLGVDVTEGSLQNVGTRLKEARVIDHTPLGWTLRDASKVPTMKDGRLFGAPGFFQSIEVASYRREIILALLGAYGALSRAQVINILRETPWLNAPAMLTPVKMDLLKLSEMGLIRRTPGADEERSWTWELAAGTPKGQAQQLRLA